MTAKSRRGKYTVIIAVFLISIFLLLILLSFQSTEEPNQNLPTNPRTIPDFNFAAVGDFGCGSNAEETVKNVQEKAPERFLALGDFSYTDTADCWLEIIEPVDQITRIVIGNHEVKSTPLLDDYMSYFGLAEQFYSFDHQNIHFLVMSTEEAYSEGSAQYNFVKADLSKAASSPNIDWIVVALHRYPYSSPGVTQVEEDLRDIYHPLFQQYEVNLVLSAHEHNYQRTYPLRFNSLDPSNPIITDTHEITYRNPQAPIFVIVGTGGVNLFTLIGQESYIAKQHVGYGFLNIDVVDNGSTLIGTFYGNDGSIRDQFTDTKSALDNNVPISHAGTDKRVLEGSNVILDGSGSVDLDGDLPLSYSWKQTGGTNNVTLINSNNARPEFVAPIVNPRGDTLVFELTARDSKGLADPTPDSVVVVISDNPYEFEPYITLAGSNYEEILSTESLQLTEFSIAAWFRTTMSLSNGSDAVIANKGGFGSETAGDNMNYGILMVNGGRIQAGFETASGIDHLVISTKTYNDGLWHFATVTHDGTVLRLYVDREPIAAKFTEGALPDSQGSQSFRVGANSFFPDRYFVGYADEVRVWNRAILPTEVTDMYLTGIADTREQVLYLPFGSGSPPTES